MAKQKSNRGKSTSKSFATINLMTLRGEVLGQYYSPREEPPRGGIIFVGGVEGNWDSPARNLYPELAKSFQENNIASLRLEYRNPRNLDEAVYDILAGINFLKSQQISRLALVGHSLGGAAVIQAALKTPETKTIVTLATQSYGTENISRLPKNCSVLFIHGQKDDVISSDASQYAWERAHQPKEIVLLEKDNHTLNKSADKIKRLVYDWITKNLLP